VVIFAVTAVVSGIGYLIYHSIQKKNGKEDGKKS
jgi:hypothetical protein